MPFCTATINRLRDELRLRHYAIRTEEAYVQWARRFIVFRGKRHPATLHAGEVAAFLTYLAVDRTVAPATQNQAKAAPLFLHRHVLAVDLLGFGYSEKPSWFDYSIQSQARMVSRFMNRLGIGRAVIVGSSYGGAVALNLTLDNAESVEKLVLVDAVSNDEPKRHPILKLPAVPGIGESITPFCIFCRQNN